MVLNSVNDSADTPKSTDVPMTQTSSNPPQADSAQNPVPPAKPKIDFNVSEEDLAAHKRQMEEEKKAQVTEPEVPKVAEQPPIVEPVKIDPPKAESPKKEEEKKDEQQQPPPAMPAFPSAAPAKDPFKDI